MRKRSDRNWAPTLVPIGLLLFVAIFVGAMIGWAKVHEPSNPGDDGWGPTTGKPWGLAYADSEEAPMAIQTADATYRITTGGRRIYCSANEKCYRSRFPILITNYGSKTLTCTTALGAGGGAGYEAADPTWLTVTAPPPIAPGQTGKAWVEVSAAKGGLPANMVAGKYAAAVYVIHGDQRYPTTVYFEVRDGPASIEEEQWESV